MSQVRVEALEINAVHHCNLACVGCSHASPVSARSFADPVAVDRDLTGLAGVLLVEHVRIVGGEPLLHPELPALISAIRTSGLKCRVRLATNGTLLHRTGWEWLDLVDEVHVSEYPGEHVPKEVLDELARRCTANGTQLLLKQYERFRLVDPAETLSGEEVQAIFDTCQLAHAWSCHTVEDGYIYMCPPSVPPYRPPSEDARCRIAPREGLDDRLRALFGRHTPLAACATCLGSVGTMVPHEQADRRSAWLTLSRGRIDQPQLERLRVDIGSHNGCYSDHEVVPIGARIETTAEPSPD